MASKGVLNLHLNILDKLRFEADQLTKVFLENKFFHCSKFKSKLIGVISQLHLKQVNKYRRFTRFMCQGTPKTSFYQSMAQICAEYSQPKQTRSRNYQFACAGLHAFKFEQPFLRPKVNMANCLFLLIGASFLNLNSFPVKDREKYTEVIPKIIMLQRNQIP